MASSTRVVLAALFANAAIAVLKFGGWALTGSPSMLSETYHSISDTGNQVFLLVGIRYGSRDPTRSHPFGYGKAQFFYSFLVSVLLFGIAGWESASHGYSAIVHPHVPPTGAITRFGVTVPEVWVNYAILLGAIGFEGYAFSKAYANVSGQIREYEWSGFVEAFQKTSDVTVLTALTEDTVAISGAGLALAGVFLTRVTGNPLYDAVTALLIGLLLMGFAVALAWQNKRLLIGESLPPRDEARLRDLILDHEGVVHVDVFRTVYFGPERAVVTADVSFDPDLETETIDDVITDIEDAIRHADDRIQHVYIEPEI
ncbi:MAG: cation diffusion facilitator family transporter [Halobacteriaceae archaeon]